MNEKSALLHDETRRGSHRNLVLAYLRGCFCFFLVSFLVFCFCFFFFFVSPTNMKTLLVLCVVSTLLVLTESVTAEQKLRNCNEVRAAFTSKGLNVNDVPNKGVHGEFYTSALFITTKDQGDEVGTRNSPGGLEIVFPGGPFKFRLFKSYS